MSSVQPAGCEVAPQAGWSWFGVVGASWWSRPDYGPTGTGLSESDFKSIAELLMYRSNLVGHWDKFCVLFLYVAKKPERGQICYE